MVHPRLHTSPVATRGLSSFPRHLFPLSGLAVHPRFPDILSFSVTCGFYLIFTTSRHFSVIRGCSPSPQKMDSSTPKAPTGPSFLDRLTRAHNERLRQEENLQRTMGLLFVCPKNEILSRALTAAAPGNLVPSADTQTLVKDLHGYIWNTFANATKSLPLQDYPDFTSYPAQVAEFLMSQCWKPNGSGRTVFSFSVGTMKHAAAPTTMSNAFVRLPPSPDPIYVKCHISAAAADQIHWLFDQLCTLGDGIPPITMSLLDAVQPYLKPARHQQLCQELAASKNLSNNRFAALDNSGSSVATGSIAVTGIQTDPAATPDGISVDEPGVSFSGRFVSPETSAPQANNNNTIPVSTITPPSVNPSDNCSAPDVSQASVSRHQEPFTTSSEFSPDVPTLPGQNSSSSTERFGASSPLPRNDCPPNSTISTFPRNDCTTNSTISTFP